MPCRPLITLFFICLFITTSFADGEFEYFKLDTEPLIRIGLSTNSSSVSITTTDSSLVSVSPDEPSRILDTSRVTVSARAYRPPEVENYRIECQNLPSQDAANELAKDVRAAVS